MCSLIVKHIKDKILFLYFIMFWPLSTKQDTETVTLSYTLLRKTTRLLYCSIMSPVSSFLLSLKSNQMLSTCMTSFIDIVYGIHNWNIIFVP